MAYDKVGDAARLKEIYTRIVDGRGETRAEFGRRSGLGGPANISHYLNGKNNLSEEAARKFAAYIPCKIDDFSPYWARKAQASGLVATNETQNPLNQGVAALHLMENTAVAHGYQAKSSVLTLKIPMLAWEQVGLMSEANETLIGMAGIDFVDADDEHVTSRTKLTQMPDDSMSPLINRGDRIKLEPEWTPEPGEVVLVRDPQGTHYIRRFKAVRPGHFIAEPVNSTDYQPLDSIQFELKVVAVVVARTQFLAKRHR